MNCSLLCVTHNRDAIWFAQLAHSYEKFATGFTSAKVVVPTADVPYFEALANGRWHVSGFDEEPGKGFLSHMRMKCYADHHLPGSDFVMHIDADCVFNRPCTPDEFFQGGRPVICYEPYPAFLRRLSTDPVTFMGCTGRERDFSQARYAWKNSVEFALGYPTARETMVQMPMVFHRDLYPALREHIAKRFGNFDEYVMSCRNEFPQTFCEFNTMGAFAFDKFPFDYIAHHGAMANNPVTQFWSHGGFESARPELTRLGLS